MTTKEYLNTYMSAKYERLNRVDELNTIIADVALENGAIQYDRDRVQSSPTNDAMYRMHERIEERSKYVIRRIEQIDRHMDYIKEQINSVDNPKHKRLLYLVYVEGYTLDEACMDEDISYSIENKGRLHSDALNSFRVKHNNQMTTNDIE